MKFQEIAKNNIQRIQQNSYPGRGLIIGKTPNGHNYVQIYWIMGRSSNSRNRILETDGSFVRTKAFDEDKLEDPSLIIYYPIKDISEYHIVSNGDQTNTIYDHIKNGKSFESALQTRCFEPDEPIFTPRISGLVDLRAESPNYKLSILKTIGNNSEPCQRVFYNYDSFISGYGHCIHTYKCDGNPAPSFEGEPFLVSLYDDIDENAECFWKQLDEDNKVSLLVKYINAEDKSIRFRLINKNT